MIDAIEFGLTGSISRLTGPGTKGLTVAEHGPHVDKSRFPDAAFVRLNLTIVESGKAVSLERRVSAPKKPIVAPLDPDLLTMVATLAQHPELTLSRREILRFILIEPTKRSEEIQALLKLDEIGQTRATLNTAQNRLQVALKAATSQTHGARTSLLQHLQVGSLKTEEILPLVNARRHILALDPIPSITTDTRLDGGIDTSVAGAPLNKGTMLKDVAAVREAVGSRARLEGQVEAINSKLDLLQDDPQLHAALYQRELLAQGLESITGAECPLCDTLWESPESLRNHLQEKLSKSTQAKAVESELLRMAAELESALANLRQQLLLVNGHAIARDDLQLSQVLTSWGAHLDGVRPQLGAVTGLTNLRSTHGDRWIDPPPALGKRLDDFERAIAALPDQTAAADAQTFLTTAQVRLQDYREAQRRTRAAEGAWQQARAAYETYCSVLEAELNTLYDEVQADFSAYYRTVNADDEERFSAKLTPTEGSLALDVNFYDRGLFPPGAYHSEGHQDGMGVCLYLALMKRLFGTKFTFALLDDVVMSVDSGHRYQFCKLLKTSFPDTQFVITTHDRLWAEQMRSAGLVTSKRSLAFHSWTVDTGPLVESNEEIWTDIDQALSRGKVEVAAAALRHHLEYVSRLLADQLGAAPQFRADGSYELGDLLPSVLRRMRELLGKATDAAQSWGNTSAKEAAAARKAHLSSCNGASNVEQWAVNKAVHYNEWANFGRTDFKPVRDAFHELLECFRCSDCDSWLYVTPRNIPESLRCACSAISLNLKAKPK